METEIVRSLYYNPDTDTLDIWLGDPSSETDAEPITENLSASVTGAAKSLVSR